MKSISRLWSSFSDRVQYQLDYLKSIGLSGADDSAQAVLKQETPRGFEDVRKKRDVQVLRVAQRGEQDLGLQLRRWGLNNSQFDVLAHVGANEGIVQQELADSLLVTKGNVAQLVGRMEGRGLVERRPAGRTNRLFLTHQGRKLFNEVVPAHETHIAERLSVLCKQEQRRLLDLLRKLDRALDGKRPSGDGSRGLPRYQGQ